MTSYRALTLAEPSDPLHLAPRGGRASAADPALSLLTDLSQGAVVVLKPEDRADDMLQVLIRAGVRMGLVGTVQQGQGTIHGAVSATDLASEQVTRIALERGIAHHEVTVEQVMSPISGWPQLDIGSLTRASVGDVVMTLQATGRRYLIVTETRGGQTSLRGVFSANRIEQSLGTTVEPSLRSQSFAELHSALQHS